MPNGKNYTTDLSKQSITIGTAAGVPGKKIDGVTIGEAIRLESTADRVSVVEGLRYSSFKVRPVSGIPYMLTINVMETAEDDIAFMDSLYQAGVPFGFTYRDGGTQRTGVAMVLGDPPISSSTDATSRAYRFGAIDVHGPVGAAASTGGGLDANP
jgi:hypothetical protein